MAQTTIRGNLSISGFPLVSDWWGRTVIISQYDENYVPPQTLSGGDSDRDRGIPQMYYGHNILPGEQGYKSVSYKQFVRPATGLGITDFDSYFIARDSNENKAFIGFTKSGKILMYTSSLWIDITPHDLPTPWAGGENSYGFADGNTYICLANYGIYKVDIVGKQLTHPAWTGIVDSEIVAICGSINYLIAATETITAWSSTTNPEDFVPSLVTGAGSGTPNDLAGIIIAVTQLNNGFAVYSTKNIVLSSFSGNTQFPWVFRNANNSAGITSKETVAFDSDQGTNYAWTAAGVLKISSLGCTPEFPQVTDFLAGKIFEDFDFTSCAWTQQYLTNQLLVKMKYTGSRYLVISYGVATYTHALVYDAAFKRWGKLKVNHVDVANIEISIGGTALPYSALAGQSYASLAGTAYDELIGLSQQAAMPKYTMGFLQADGTVVVMDPAYGDDTADAVAVFGKYQLSRNQAKCTLQEIDFENVLSGSNNFDVKIITTQDGKNASLVTSPTLVTNQGSYRRYNSRVSGMNHSFAIHGAFNAVSYELVVSRQGRR